MNLTKLSPPFAILESLFFQQEEDLEEKRRIPLYQTWHIVHIKWYYILSFPIILSYHRSYQVASPHIPFYPIVLCPLLSYPIISHHIKPQHIKSPSSLLEALENFTIISMIGSCLVPSCFY